MRVFVAIDLPDEVRRELETLQNALPVGRPVPAENLHLTLSFLGDQQ
jgi:2'-5' RNA ligase